VTADELSRLREAGTTGVLHVSGDNWPTSQIYLMDGEIVACCCADDAANLERILLSSQLIDEALLAEWRPWLDEGADLVDMMVTDGQFSTDELIVARSSLFDDNFAWTLAHPNPQLQFEKLEAVFPDNIQFDLDGGVLIGDVVAWIEGVGAVLLAAADSAQVFAAVGELPEGWNEDDWAQLREPRTMAALLGLLGPPRTEATMLIGEWLKSGVLASAEGAGPAAVDGGDEYARAARGDFVRSYEVLDKVDLTGVPILGLGTDSVDDPESTLDHEDGKVEGDEETLPPVALGEYAEEGDELAAPDPEGGAFDEQETQDNHPSVEFVDDPTPSIEGWDSMSDEPPPVKDADDFAAEAESWDHFQAIDSLEALEAVDGAPPPLPGAATEFDAHELQAFGSRIDTFNDIFRIIYGTYAGHLGEADTEQRFEQLLSSGEREQAPLFEGLQPGSDGTLSADGLIANLALLESDSPEDLLKGGLYELLFSHLSDSKEVLPGDIEAAMMEQLVVFEQKLNQP
jgi:hypothetical protein